MREPTREDIIQQLRNEVLTEFKENMRNIRLSQLTEEEKRTQREAMQKEKDRLLTIYK